MYVARICDPNICWAYKLCNRIVIGMFEHIINWGSLSLFFYCVHVRRLHILIALVQSVVGAFCIIPSLGMFLFFKGYKRGAFIFLDWQGRIMCNIFCRIPLPPLDVDFESDTNHNSVTNFNNFNISNFIQTINRWNCWFGWFHLESLLTGFEKIQQAIKKFPIYIWQFLYNYWIIL